MKRLLFTILLFTAALPAAAQLYHPGEQLFYRVSYKAKMFPNTEVGAVEVKTSEVQLDDRKLYKVEGIMWTARGSQAPLNRGKDEAYDRATKMKRLQSTDMSPKEPLMHTTGRSSKISSDSSVRS